MKATLTSESYRTGQMIVKFFILSQQASLPGHSQKFSELQLSYDMDKNSCLIEPVIDDDLTDDEDCMLGTTYFLDTDQHDPLMLSTDRYVIRKYLDMYKKLEIEADSSVFEEY